MAFNIEAFRANGPVKGGARPNYFAVRMATIPNIPDASAGVVASKMNFMCSSASLPPTMMGVARVPYFGRFEPLPGDREFSNWEVTIINDEDFYLRSFFEAWSNKMNAFISNVGDSDRVSDYKIDAEVLQYGKSGPSSDAGVIRSYKFVGLFPTEISPIRLDWADTNQIEMFQVSFAYSYWVPGDLRAGNGVEAVDYNPLSPTDGSAVTFNRA